MADATEMVQFRLKKSLHVKLQKLAASSGESANVHARKLLAQVLADDRPPSESEDAGISDVAIQLNAMLDAIQSVSVEQFEKTQALLHSIQDDIINATTAILITAGGLDEHTATEWATEHLDAD